ncbi:MAG: PH domain-containing protein [Oscillospiraceae bacterium]|nr:PH domain-containing protein [Oscillospiraceae bacterium]
MINLYHEHPLKILKYSIKHIWLLIFPLLRGIKAYRLDVNRLYEWLKGSWFDILIILIILFFGYLKWYFSTVSADDFSINHHKGILFRTKTCMIIKNISSVTVEKPFYLRPFKAVVFYADTRSGTNPANDMKLLLKQSTIKIIMDKVPSVSHQKSRKYSYKPRIFLIFLFSALFSSSFSGVIYITTFFFQGGEIALDIIRKSIDIISAETSKFIITKVPPVIWSIIIFILSTWLLSFIINLIRYTGFSIRHDSDIIQIKSGYFTKRQFNIFKKKINYIDIHQNLIMKLFKVMSVNISCSGYGSGTKNLPVLVPLVTRRTLNENLSDIVHARFSLKKQYKPKKTSFWQYIWLSVIISVSILPLTSLITYFVPDFYKLALFITVMAETPAVWSIIIGLTALFSSGITFDEGYIQLNYAKGFVFHTVIAEPEKIVKFCIKQSIFQRIFKKCTVFIYIGSEKPTKHIIKAIPLDDAYEVLEKINKSY